MLLRKFQNGTYTSLEDVVARPTETQSKVSMALRFISGKYFKPWEE